MKLVPRPALSEKEVEAFRARITSVATRLFAEKGFEAVTLRAVAADLGVSAMALYRYVEGKDELLALVRTEAFRRFADAQAHAVPGPGDALARLRRQGEAYVRFALEHPDAYRIMFELRQPSSGHEELDRESARSFSYLHDAVKRAVDAGLLEGDPLTLAHIFWASTHGIVSLHLAGKLRAGTDVDALAREAIARLVPSGRGR